MGKASMRLRAVVLATAAAMTLAACGGGDGGGGGGGGGGAGGGGEGEGEAQKGGTLNFLTIDEQFTHLDPQRNYTGEDLAFASGYLHRTLNAYKFSPDEQEATELVADMATDTGTSNEDATQWSWTLKEGMKWEDGSDVTCEDVKYGVSRTFATDIITDGPQYAVSMLDIPKAKDGTSVYKGPYVTKDNDTAAYDKAVTCDGQTITFNLANPVADFNYTVTLLSFAAVPKAADTGEKYDDKPLSNGPYKITEYSKGSQLVMDRNENWDPATDEYRPAYPDKIVVQFAQESSVIDQRLIQDAGEDKNTLTVGDPIEPQTLSTVFGSDRFKDRAVNEFDPYVRYIAINTDTVPNLEHRKAIAAAMDRQQMLTVLGGEYAGTLGDGVIKPNLAQDYEETGMFDGLLGQEIPDSGDPEYAKQLLEESGEPLKTLKYDYAESPTNQKVAAALQGSLERAGIKVELNPIEPGQYYGIVLDPERQGDLTTAGWGPDWANASTVVPELFSETGGFDLSRGSTPEFEEKVAQARTETDREAQSELWKELNKEAMANVWAIPTRFGRTQRIAGSNVKAASGEDGKVYLWAPYGSWPYGELYLKQ